MDYKETKITGDDLKKIRDTRDHLLRIEDRFDNKIHSYNDHKKIGRILCDLNDLEIMILNQLKLNGYMD